MASHHHARWLAAVAVVAIGAVSVTTGPSLAASPAGSPGVDRASLEALLAERVVQPTGETKRFDLTLKRTPWELLPGVTTDAVTFNGTVPGPTIRVTEGDTVEVVVRNELDESTSVHWHGLHVPNDQDGVAGVTQAPIGPGETFTYRFVAPHAGTFMYHAHGDQSREQIDKGLYAPFIIDPQGPDPIAADTEYTLALQGWLVGTGGADGMDSMEGMGDGDPAASMSMDYDYFTINGKAYPSTAVIDVEQGDFVRLRFINPSQTIHPMHLHGMDMAVFAKDGEPLTQPQRLNTLPIEQGETYDVAFIADNPGTWLLHCHDLHHASNAGVEPGGLVMVVRVREAGTPEPSGDPVPMGAAPSMSPDPHHMPSMPGM
jgi:FtsP/CotA-like multicopper oxidase with cupredoxin domain